MIPEHAELRGILRARLRELGDPVFVFHDAAIPAASIWVGVRAWIAAGREAGLGPGAPVQMFLPPSAAAVQVAVAAMWEGWRLEVGRSASPDAWVRIAVEPEGSAPCWAPHELVRPGRCPPLGSPLRAAPGGPSLGDGGAPMEVGALLRAVQTPVLGEPVVITDAWTDTDTWRSHILPALGSADLVLCVAPTA